VICGDEAELHMVREAALGADMSGAMILRERLYPVKINGANRSAVLGSNHNLLLGASEAFGQENEVTISRMNWLSDKRNGKVYESMVMYVAKESDARRLLEARTSTSQENRRGPACSSLEPVWCIATTAGC
jgi:hypothetical protein